MATPEVQRTWKLLLGGYLVPGVFLVIGISMLVGGPGWSRLLGLPFIGFVLAMLSCDATQVACDSEGRFYFRSWRRTVEVDPGKILSVSSSAPHFARWQCAMIGLAYSPTGPWAFR
jgi:hypothetical protein